MPKRTGDKYEAIIEAAIHVISQQGYHSAQVARIAKAAGVADGTIYLYFENKEDILISLFREKMGEFLEKLNEQLSPLPSANEQLFALVQHHFGYMSQNREYAIVTQVELRQSNPHVQASLGQILKKYLEQIDRVILNGREQGLFSKEVDPRLARQMIFGTLDQVVTTWIMKDGKYDLNSMTEPVVRLLLHGLEGRS